MQVSGIEQVLGTLLDVTSSKAPEHLLCETSHRGRLHITDKLLTQLLLTYKPSVLISLPYVTAVLQRVKQAKLR